MRWCELILRGAGSFAQASEMAWKGVCHCSRFRSSEVVGRDEGEDVGLQALQVGVVEHLDGSVLDGPVDPLGLAVRPGMIRLRQFVGDPVFPADPVENMPYQVAVGPLWHWGRSANAMPLLVRTVDRIGEYGDHLPQEGRPIHLGGRAVEGDVGELAHPVDGQEDVELAFRQAQLAVIDVDVADMGFGKAPALGGASLRLWAIERRRAEPGSGEGRCGSAWGCSRAGSPEHHQAAAGCGAGTKVLGLDPGTMASSALVRTVLRGRLGPIG